MTAHTSKAGRFAGLLFSACLALLLIPAQAADALTITVEGATYDVQYVAGESFNGKQALLTTAATAPWWGLPAATAIKFRDEYAIKFLSTAGSDPSLIQGSVSSGLIFAYDFARVGGVVGNEIHMFYLNFTDGELSAGANGFSRTFSYPSIGYAYVAASPSAVPEITAGSLAQALLILLAFWLVTRSNNRPSPALRTQDSRP